MTPPSILVVDDEPDVEVLISQMFRRQVRKGELTFLFAQDGQQALEVLRSGPAVDVVLSDINMPRMDGLTLLERLNDLDADLKTVIVSAYGDLANIRTAMNRGAFDFITKPIEFDDLESTLAKTLEHIHMLRSLRQEKEAAEKAQAILERFFSPSVSQQLLQDPEILNAGGARRAATFLFTDLTDFTQMVETSASEFIVSVLNEYLEGMTETVFAHGGTVMKIIGDSVHAIFGAPLEQPDHARRAVECALALDEFATSLQARMAAEGTPLGTTRIGVNSGKAVIGNFGGKRFYDYTAYGDAVNIAARLEQANKAMGTRICIGESVVEQIPGFSGRPMGTLMLKGKSREVRCYEPLSPGAGDDPAMAAYLAAFDLLRVADPKAKQAFAALVGRHDEDPLAMFHLGRLMAGNADDRIEI